MHRLVLKDKLMVTGATTGCITFNLDDPRVDLKTVETVPQGVRVSFKTPERVRRGDKLFKVVPKGTVPFGSVPKEKQ